MDINYPLQTAGNIQPPQSLAKLQQTFKDFDNVLIDIDGILSPLDAILNDIIPILELPKDLNKAITEMNEVILSVEAASAILIAIPIVGEVVAGVDEVVDEILEVVTEFQETVLTPMSEFCTPIEDAIKKIEKPIQDIDAAVKDLESAVAKCGPSIMVIQEALALAAGIGNGFDAAGQKAVGDIFAKLVDTYNDVVIKIVGDSTTKGPLTIIDDAMKDIDKVLHPLSDAISKLQSGTFDKIGNSVRKIDDFLTKLNPLNDFLKHIQVVLKPFEWVLDSIGKIINKILGPILRPLLKPLADKIMAALGFPKDFIAELKSALGDSTDGNTTTSSSAKVVTNQTTVATNQPTLETTMTGFFSGDVNVICANLLKIIQEHSKTN